MEFLELKDISESYLDILNPTSAEKILAIGRMAGMAPGKTVIDFGCGFAGPLVLWAEQFGISGIGIELRPKAVQRARDRIAERGLSERLQVIESRGDQYHFEPHSFDFATCIGATFIWDGYRQALQALKKAIRPDGRLVVGEAYWLKDNVPPELAQKETSIRAEYALLQMTRQEGLDLEYALRASHDDWDRYEASNWYSLLRWIEANPEHPSRQEVIDYLHECQEEYTRFGREYFGWALYLLNPVKYGLSDGRHGQIHPLF